MERWPGLIGFYSLPLSTVIYLMTVRDDRPMGGVLDNLRVAAMAAMAADPIIASKANNSDNTNVALLELHMLDRMRQAGRRATASALERDGAALRA